MYRPTDLRISGASRRLGITTSSQSIDLPNLTDGTTTAKRVAVTVYGDDEAFVTFTAGAKTVSITTGHHQSQEDGMQVYWVAGNTHYNVIGLTTGSVFCITPLDN